MSSYQIILRDSHVVVSHVPINYSNSNFTFLVLWVAETEF